MFAIIASLNIIITENLIWIKVITITTITMSLLFYSNCLPSAILYRQMMKSQNDSCFEDCSKILIRICLFLHHVQSNFVNVSLIILLDAHQFWKRISWPNDRKHSTRVVFYFMFGICRKIELIPSFHFRFFLHLNTIDTLSLLNSWMLHSTWNLSIVQIFKCFSQKHKNALI